MLDFVSFLLVLFLIAIFLRVDFFFTVIYFLAATYLLSRIWLQRTMKNLAVQRHFVDRAFTGDEVKVDLTVRNGGWLPVPWMEVSESLPVQLRAMSFRSRVISLGSHEPWTFSYTLSCRRRGYYQVGPMTVQTGDLLGIQGRVLARVEPARMTVYPRVVALSQLGIPTRSPMVALAARSPLFEDASRIMGVRDYRRGDSPRRIHWSSTARANRLVVKQYQPAIARETLICLNLDEDDYDSRRRFYATELAIVVAASIASHVILKERLPVGLVTEAVDPLFDERRRIALAPRAERGHLMANLLETLARVQPTTAAPLTDLLRRETVHLSWGATVVVITGQESEELLNTLIYLQRSGYAVSLVLVQPALASAELRERSALISVPVHRVWEERDLETWQ